jgi:hypothetical protein
MPASDATRRFSSRVENYVRYRPGYPVPIIDLLAKECGLHADSMVADIAFGTGIFTKLLLENGNGVFGVEPNADMRAAGSPTWLVIPDSQALPALPRQQLWLITAWIWLPQHRPHIGLI